MGYVDYHKLMLYQQLKCSTWSKLNAPIGGNWILDSNCISPAKQRSVFSILSAIILVYGDIILQLDFW